jgi:hypothetical protein
LSAGSYDPLKDAVALKIEPLEPVMTMVVFSEFCGRKAITRGYYPCGRKPGHDGPCAHRKRSWLKFWEK